MWEQDRRLNCGARQQAESQLKRSPQGEKAKSFYDDAITQGKWWSKLYFKVRKR